MLHPPEDLDEKTLAAALTREWGIAVASLTYRPLGFGSHHWTVVDAAGTSWFATVDELVRRRRTDRDTLDAAYTRLRRALDTARALRDTGAAFVVAPVITAGDEPVTRLGAAYSLVLHPMVDGESFEFGAYAGDEHRAAVLDMLLDVHAAPAPVRGRASVDDLSIAHRDALEAALDGDIPDAGPYAERLGMLLAEHEEPIRRLLARYDALATEADPARAVLTHGEPHPGNTMRAADGWRLIDWDTALVAQPERDLWILGPDMQQAYTAATGVALRPALLEMFRLRWDIVDLAIDTDRFRQPHTGTPDDEQSWTVLQRVAAGITT